MGGGLVAQVGDDGAAHGLGQAGVECAALAACLDVAQVFEVDDPGPGGDRMVGHEAGGGLGERRVQPGTAPCDALPLGLKDGELGQQQRARAPAALLP